MKIIALAAAMVCAVSGTAQAATVVASGTYDESGPTTPINFTVAPGHYQFDLLFSGDVNIDRSSAIQDPALDTYVAVSKYGFPTGTYYMDTSQTFTLRRTGGSAYQTEGTITGDASAILDQPYSTLYYNHDEMCCSVDLLGFSASTFGTFTISVSAIPEPATWLIMTVGFGGVGVALRRRIRPAVIA